MVNFGVCSTTKLEFKPTLNAIRRYGSVKKIFHRKSTTTKQLQSPNLQNTTENNIRKNDLNIQMIPSNLHSQIFRNAPEVSHSPNVISKCKEDLKKHQINYKTTVNEHKSVNLQLPPLKGKDIEEHFYIIGEEQAKPYRKIIHKLLTKIPEPPSEWLLEEGWMRYAPSEAPIKVPYPLEESVVFDVEVCMSAGKAPTLATAVSTEAWYGWVSKSLIDEVFVSRNFGYNLDCLICMESENGLINEWMKREKVVVGHNVAFDRAKIREQYFLERSGMRFLDTMSLHVCVGGLTSYQRAALKSKKFVEEDSDWKGKSSLNNLEDVYRLYCGKDLEKSTRQLFVESDLKEIKENFQEAMNYCSNDVKATYEVLQKLFPLFLERFPHPVTLAGMLELSTVYLPVNKNWLKYIENCETTYAELEAESRLLLANKADNACQLLHNEKYKEDLWLWDQDWETKDLKLKKTVKKSKVVVNEEEFEENEIQRIGSKFSYLWKQEVSSRGDFLPGYPSWYKKLCRKDTDNWVPGPHLITSGMQITPKLLNLTWEGYPLHYIRGKGWGFLVPFTTTPGDSPKSFPLAKLIENCPILQPFHTDRHIPEANLQEILSKLPQELSKKQYPKKPQTTTQPYTGSGIWCNTILHNSTYFLKLPHKDGDSKPVGNPLAKDFLNKFTDNSSSAGDILKIARKLSYWRNNRDRITDQMVVWLNGKVGAIVPQVVVCGTLTRRAVEPTWLTASNALGERLGSELRSMVQAPDGYCLVGADVDSQELWIASVMGDADACGVHGGTPLGWMTLSGTKGDGSDMHSVTAKAVGVSRDQAKVLNYARIYGAGQSFAEHLLKQFNPEMNKEEAKRKARIMFTLTKGKKYYRIKEEYSEDFHQNVFTQWDAYELSKKFAKKPDDIFHKPKWQGGTESAMFNRLEQIARSESPKTPFLDGSLSRALESESDDRFLPTRINWIVQSGAVDFLHLMLVSMKWILKDKARFCLSFHDEVRYLVKSDFKYKAALAMHVTNLLTRSFCVSKLGIYDLPQSVAFFSSVEVDRVLRKEAKQNCVTPSNPHGLEKGYGIPHGESVDIFEAVAKAGGDTRWFDFDGEK